MLKVIPSINETMRKRQKKRRIFGIKIVSFPGNIWHLHLHKTSVRLFLSATDVRMKQVNHRI